MKGWFPDDTDDLSAQDAWTLALFVLFCVVGLGYIGLYLLGLL